MAFFNGQIHSIPSEIVTDLKMVLDFVERYNKQDKESNVSQAAANLEAYIDSYELAANDEHDL